MIRPLRRAHRGAFALLALGLPALLAGALALRHERAVQELPDDLWPAAPAPEDAREDLLVYWVDASVPSGGPLPEDAELAGSLRTGARERAVPVGRVAVWYSLIEGRILGRAEQAGGRE